MKDLQREILSQVASGSITAAEAAARLEALGAEPASAGVQVQAPTAARQAVSASKSIRVISHLGSATIVGDPTVTTATAEGPHSARQDGDVMTIELGPLGRDDTFSFGPIAGRLVNGLGKSRDELIVRMNPDLALFARVRAGDVRVTGVHGPMTLEVQAGDCKVDDFRSALNVLVQAGSVRASGRLDGGSSTVKCQMGEVKLNLEKGSSVRIAARSTLGEVSIDGSNIRRGESGRDVQIGSGAGTLDLECTMGDIQVNAE